MLCPWMLKCISIHGKKLICTHQCNLLDAVAGRTALAARECLTCLMNSFLLGKAPPLAYSMIMWSLFNPSIQIKLRNRRNNTKMILYGSSDLCAIRDRPHPLINMENYIPY